MVAVTVPKGTRHSSRNSLSMAGNDLVALYLILGYGQRQGQDEHLPRGGCQRTKGHHPTSSGLGVVGTRNRSRNDHEMIAIFFTFSQGERRDAHVCLLHGGCHITNGHHPACLKRLEE